MTNIDEPYDQWNVIPLIEAFAAANDINIATARKRVKDNPILMEKFARIAIASCNSFISDARWQMRLGFTEGGRSPTGEKPKRAAAQAA